jgi:uncharacterized protein
MRALFDVNVLIALLDEGHQHHRLAWNWFDRHIEFGWASCAITQNGYLRIVSQSSYLRPSTLAEAFDRLREATQTPHHEYWTSDVSLLDKANITRLHNPAMITDAYLLALAVSQGGRFVTLDQRVLLQSVSGATELHCVKL